MSIFKAFSKDRKIGLTDFDLSFQNLSTANFGELRPVGCYPVLPKDKWKIGSNILTKVEPMPAPAFTRIKQNVYSFFTPNQAVWKHWNDFVSNGTAYADTYGNNSNTQKVDNLWQEPSVRVNDLQLISKIANGWAIPVFDIPTDAVRKLHDIMVVSLGTDLYNPFAAIFNDNLNTDYFHILLTACKLKKSAVNANITEIFEDIPYFEFCCKKNSGEYFMQIGCDYYTAYKFQLLIQSLTHLSSEKSIEETPDLHSEIDYDYRDYTTYQSYVRVFCDDISDNTELSHGPFMLVKKQGIDPVYHRPFNYYAYKKNLYHDEIINNNSCDGESAGAPYMFERSTRLCGYFWSSDIQMINLINTNEGTRRFVINNVNCPSVVYHSNSVDLLSLLGVTIDELLAFDDLLSLHNFKNYYNEIFYEASNIDGINIPEVGSYAWFTMTTQPQISAHPYRFTSLDSASWENFPLLRYEPVNNYINPLDVNFPLLLAPSFITSSSAVFTRYYAALPTLIPFSYESFNIGYDIWSFVIYCSKNATKFLDSINIPLEGITSRDFSNYAGEYVKMLLPFTYSKIWNDYFRNKVTSSAELDYSETNGVACYSENTQKFDSAIYHVNPKSFPSWLLEHLENNNYFNYKNGWSIPFSCSPKNALEDAEIEINGSTVRLADFNHFHDLRIRNYFSLFCVLTGSQLMDLCLLNISNFTNNTTSEVYGILANKMYLPSYYNGLLHLKYQNFNKDYFSSALLDPASGANDEEIGTTVSSLVTAQAKQGFWNQLAQNRSLKQFWNRMFDIDPSHDDYDKPLLLGSNHTDINVGEVVQLSQTDTTPQGMRSGLGSAHDKSALCHKQFNEHGYIIVLVSHTLELQYMQGLEKDFTPNNSFLDLPFIDFVGLGNQNILQKELNFTTKPKYYFQPFSNSSLADGASLAQDSNINLSLSLNKINYSYPSVPRFVSRVNSQGEELPEPQQVLNLNLNLANGSGQSLNDTFGFIPRYSSWKCKFDQCHGEFRNQLMFWHSFRKFFTQPILCHEFVNWEFVAENDELNRMFFVIDNSTDKFKLDIFINATASRPLPYVCTPATSK